MYVYIYIYIYIYRGKEGGRALFPTVPSPLPGPEIGGGSTRVASAPLRNLRTVLKFGLLLLSRFAPLLLDFSSEGTLVH